MVGSGHKLGLQSWNPVIEAEIVPKTFDYIWIDFDIFGIIDVEIIDSWTKIACLPWIYAAFVDFIEAFSSPNWV